MTSCIGRKNGSVIAYNIPYNQCVMPVFYALMMLIYVMFISPKSVLQITVTL